MRSSRMWGGIAIVLIICCCGLAAEDTWTYKADIPTARTWVGGCVLDGKIYVIGGATSVGYTIPMGHATGSFDYTVQINCPTNPSCAVESDPASVSVVAQPDGVGMTMVLW